jgi:hypothetical protein
MRLGFSIVMKVHAVVICIMTPCDVAEYQWSSMVNLKATIWSSTAKRTTKFETQLSQHSTHTSRSLLVNNWDGLCYLHRLKIHQPHWRASDICSRYKYLCIMSSDFLSVSVKASYSWDETKTAWMGVMLKTWMKLICPPKFSSAHTAITALEIGVYDNEFTGFSRCCDYVSFNEILRVGSCSVNALNMYKGRTGLESLLGMWLSWQRISIRFFWAYSEILGQKPWNHYESRFLSRCSSGYSLDGLASIPSGARIISSTQLAYLPCSKSSHLSKNKQRSFTWIKDIRVTAAVRPSATVLIYWSTGTPLNLPWIRHETSLLVMQCISLFLLEAVLCSMTYIQRY